MPTNVEPLRIGVVGLGISFALLTQHLAGADDLRIVAGCDPRLEACERFRADFGGECYADFAAFCADPAVEVVYLMTPNPLHCEQAVMAANHGRHVVVDKPFALTIEECEEMIAAAERNGVFLMSGASHSFDPGIRAMRRLIASDEFGRLRMVSSWNFNDWAYRSRAAWEMRPGAGGNVVFNQGAHQIDIVRLLGGGMVRSVRATTGLWDPDRPIEGAYSAYLDFEDGASATLVFNAYAHFDIAELNDWVGETTRHPDDNIRTRRQFIAAREMGAETAAKEGARYGSHAPIRPAFPKLSIYGLTIASCEKADIRQSPEGLIVYADRERRDIPVSPHPGYSIAALENMYDAVRMGGAILRNGAWSKATIEVILAILRSAAERQEIHLHHQVPSPE